MALDWDILLDSVSIKDQISGFQVVETKGAYARELLLYSPDPDFHDQFDYTLAPQLRIEVKTKIESTWVSQGEYYIEQPILNVDPDSTLNQGVWGRSETAVAGPPFAVKVTKSWDTDTTCQTVIDEMAALVGLSVVFEIDDYTIFADSYAVDTVYPIDVITELAGFAGGYVGCTAAGDLTVKPNVFHPAAADHTITDIDIIDISESVVYPEFGNRVRISAIGRNAGYQVSLTVLGDSDCLPADGESSGTLLAFVTNQGAAVADNTMVRWESEDGATLEQEYTATGSYLISNNAHNADNYYSVTVDYLVSEVMGIWAYSDTSHTNNYWDPDNIDSQVDGKKISVHGPFLYCDQALVVTYITTGCAVNAVVAGNTALDVEVIANVDGAEDSIDVKLGNTCACGSSLGTRVSPSGSICFGNEAHILIWGVINSQPAVGMVAEASISDACGSLSSTKKILDTVGIEGEIGYVKNEIAGVSQVETEITPADTATPEVYLSTDANQSDDLYSSHSDKIIDLNETLATGVEVIINYDADGAAVIAWQTSGITEECNVKVTVEMADGTEAGLSDSFDLSANDCSEPAEIPRVSDYWSNDDPSGFDTDLEDGGDVPDDDGDSGAILTACDIAALNRTANYGNAADEEKDKWRFGVQSEASCPPEGEDYSCSCTDMCASEMYEKGNTYDYEKTLHEQTIETYAEGSPEYNEEYNRLQEGHMAECEQKCADTREEVCEPECVIVSGPDVLSPGESAEYVCSDGATESVTMPEGACGSHEFTVGCCTFYIRSTDGQWVAKDEGAPVIAEHKGLTAESEYSPNNWVAISGRYRIKQSVIFETVSGNAFQAEEDPPPDMCSGEFGYSYWCSTTRAFYEGWSSWGCLSTPDYPALYENISDQGDCGTCSESTPVCDGGFCSYSYSSTGKLYGVPSREEWQCL